ncbi:hypothetical protein [Paraburkholderia azotifigens]|uniref:Uncharacterized protein n=1 Tax=Paraburkholderia azotifigens TaxID=2057004 RepID=A0ABU9R2T0_9BURK|nr:hypothetical protein [Paraburkholderia azotifigens]
MPVRDIYYRGLLGHRILQALQTRFEFAQASSGASDLLPTGNIDIISGDPDIPFQQTFSRFFPRFTGPHSTRRGQAFTSIAVHRGQRSAEKEEWLSLLSYAKCQ